MQHCVVFNLKEPPIVPDSPTEEEAKALFGALRYKEGWADYGQSMLTIRVYWTGQSPNWCRFSSFDTSWHDWYVLTTGRTT